METVSRLVNRPPVPLPAAAAPVASACIKVAHPVRAQCQSLRLSSPDDAAEVEARSVARQVVSMPARQTASRPGTLRSPATLARSQATPPAHAAPAPATPAARLSQPTSGGEALPESLRRDMEPRFGADFSRIRIHRDARAAQASRQLNAAAFTIGHQIYFGQGQWQPDSAAGRELIAHELTHTIQQGAAGQIRRSGPTAVAVNSPPAVQRLGMGDALNYFADAANAIPGYTLLTLIIGRNPINMQVVERNVTNVLRAFIGLIPGGEILFQVLQRYGVVDRIGNWVNTQTAALGLNFQTVRDAFVRFTGSLGFSAIFSPGEVWQRALTIFMPIIGRITGFVGGLVTQAVIWLKETFMEPLSGFCRQIPGYGLVTVMLGRDPFTNAPVPRTALPVVRAFAEFIPDGTEKVDQLVQSGALERAYTWFQQETGARNLTWARVSGTFTAAWATLQLSDVLHPIDTMQRMVGLFRPLFVDLVSFAGAALMKLLELIYEAAMGAGGRRILDILMRARSTFIVIIRNPVGFLRNLLGAVGQGVRQFMNNILGHLRDGVIAWLTGPVARAGIQVPERWDARGIIWFVLQILGLTWANVRGKLVRLIGEPAMATLEGGFALINDIRERGLVVALRERVTEFFGNLRESALGAIRSFIQERIVMAGITQLLSMLIPVAAIMQAIQKTYTTIQFFIQKINQILDFVESIVNSIAAIASGAIGAAATFVERTMARTIPVILDFLARFIGLGDVGAQVQTTIRNLQGAVDRMLDRAVDWVRAQAARLASTFTAGGRGGAGAVTRDSPPAARKEAAKRRIEAALERGVSGSALAVMLPQVKQATFLSDIRIVRGPGARARVQYFASAPDETELATPDVGTMTADGARTGPTTLTFTGNSSLATPYAAVRNVYGASTNESFPWRVRESSWQRPSTASANLAGDLQSHTRTSVIGTSGAIGNDEHRLLTGAEQGYHGGHLIGLQLAGVDTNDARNLAPQRGSFNSGTYLQLENLVRASPVPLAGGDKNMTARMTISVTVQYPGASYTLTAAQLRARGAISAAAPAGPDVTIPRRIPARWTMQVSVVDTGFVLSQRTPTAGTRMATQARGTAAASATFITATDTFVWWRVGGTPSPASTSVGGDRQMTVVGEQATP